MIEPLESRIAPASLISYLDADEDLVKITASTGTLDASLLSLTSGDPTTPGTLTLKGDLGKIVSGNGIADDGPSLKTLSVRSLGQLGLITQGNSGDLTSTINGEVVALKVTGDIRDAAFQPTSIDSITVGGSLAYGNIYTTGDIGPVKIGKDILGEATGSISCETGGTIGSVTVGGSLIGGSGARSGSVLAGNNASSTATLGKVAIGGSVKGGSGANSGEIFSESSLGAVRIGFDLVGGSTQPVLWAEGSQSAGVKVGGSIFGGSGDNSGGMDLRSGTLTGKVVIGGSIIAGSASDTGLVQLGPIDR